MDICIDFDGTCVKHNYPYIGEDIGAATVLRALVNKGHRLILFTMRSEHHLVAAVDWFQKNDIELFGVNKNPSQTAWTKSPKAYGHLYIDDAALGCPLIRLPGERPFVDWGKVAEQLDQKGIL